MAGAKSDSNATEQADKSPKTRPKKALLAEAKEQYVKKKGGDTMEVTKMTQVIKKKHEGLESLSCGTQKNNMLEEKESLRKDLQISHVDQGHGHSMDKERDRSGDCPIKGPTGLTILKDPEMSTSLVHTGPIHGAATQSQPLALQSLPGGSESLKASEDKLTWPKNDEDLRGAKEETESSGVKSSLSEDISEVTEDRVQGEEDYRSFGNGLKGSLNQKPFQKPETQLLELRSEPSSSFAPPFAASSSDRLRSYFPRRGEHEQLPDFSRQLQTGDSEALKSTKKSLEGQLDPTLANKTETSLPVRDVFSRNCSLGLQWIPELHSNYVQLKMVPEKMDLTRSNGRQVKSVAPGPADLECRKPTRHRVSPEVPLTSRRLMDVRMGELPSWLALQRPSLRTVPELGLRAWTRYYNKYINVRKGGVGGVAMLLAGYCALSYSWNYHHIRRDRWRKYH